MSESTGSKSIGSDTFAGTSDPKVTGLGINAKVYLVGAGPGDPGLVTVKAMDCIRKADVVVYDYLASPILLDAATPEAECIYVGKKGGDHTLSQDEINDLICKKALEGNIVTRLKGGDPFIFGRGGEEAEILMEKGIAFEIVPGVTSAIAAPAYAGIPLTHRDHNATVAFVTGHEDPTKEKSMIDWDALAKGIGTVVFLMGVKNLPKIVDQLVAHGRSTETPVALVRWGTRPIQTSVTGTLKTIVARVTEAGLKAPAIIVVGEVVRLRKKLKWFETRPLFGKRILVTRARKQASYLVEALSDLGADCVSFPTIDITPPNDWALVDEALQALDRYGWMVFTSVNGVDFFFDRLKYKRKDVRDLGHIRTAVIGPATAERLRENGFKSDIIPETYQAESVVHAFASEKMTGKRVLLPRAAEARPVIPHSLRAMGAVVDEVPVYQTLPIKDHNGSLKEKLKKRQIDMITFTSSSTVKNFVSLFPAKQIPSLLNGVALVSIGPITTQTATELNLQVDVTAEEFTIPGLIAAIRDYFAN